MSSHKFISAFLKSPELSIKQVEKRVFSDPAAPRNAGHDVSDP